jgi:hypothetical protein
MSAGLLHVVPRYELLHTDMNTYIDMYIFEYIHETIPTCIYMHTKMHIYSYFYTYIHNMCNELAFCTQTFFFFFHTHIICYMGFFQFCGFKSLAILFIFLAIFLNL